MIKFISPPFSDPTQSYPSLPILKGSLQEQGIAIEIFDWNIEGHRTLLQQFGHQQVIDLFQSTSAFFKPHLYHRAKEGLLTFYRQLTDHSANYQFSNNAHFHRDGPWNFKRLRNYCSKNHSPFDTFYRQQMSQWGEIQWLGLSCTFVSQFPEVFYLAHLARKLFPNIRIIVGGPAIAQAIEAVCDQPAVIKQFFEYFDYLCFDEGEITLALLLADTPKPRKDIPNLLFMHESEIVRTHRQKLPPKQFALPNFQGFDLSSYLAPSPIILYNPSRGCYWNRCSFCHYGFNQADGCGYREVTAEMAYHHIKQLKDQYHVEHFYFSSDVLSPRFAREFSALAIERELGILWSTDLRIEKQYTADLCSQLARSGMISVAFGIESGSDTLLEFIDKGISAAEIVDINRNFANAGIATCWMTFNYHPKETVKQALETFDLIEQQSECISLFIAGEFGLTVGSKIYRDPKKYGLSKIFFHPDDQFKIYPYCEMMPEENLSIDASAKIDRRLSKIEKRYSLASYPFKGAISTHHSFLHFKKFGRTAFYETRA